MVSKRFYYYLCWFYLLIKEMLKCSFLIQIPMLISHHFSTKKKSFCLPQKYTKGLCYSAGVHFLAQQIETS